MSAGDVDRTERERRDADARYNRALTDLDRVIVDARGRALVREDFDRLTTALIVFLQHITAFVESKDRQIVCENAARFERVEEALRTTDELRTQVGVLRRALQAFRREVVESPSIHAHGSAESQSPPGNPSAAIPEPPRLCGDNYLAFEDQFRGSAESVEARVREYVPIFHGTSDVVDLGCGRGEFLAALKAAGIGARGVDTNREMVGVARERGVDAIRADALEYLTSVADQSIGGLIATQMVEHLEPSYLIRVLETASEKMRPGAPIVLETINPACWLAFFSSYIRDFTHVRPVHPETLQYLLRASGFERIELRYSAPVPDQMKMRTVDLPADVLASAEPHTVALVRAVHTINTNAIVLNNLMFTHMDYAAIGYRC
jgi:SAM-dependent methyltransferase